jgi:hypothetical protein
MAVDGPRLLEFRPPAFSRQKTNSEYRADMSVKLIIPQMKYGMLAVLLACTSN